MLDVTVERPPSEMGQGGSMAAFRVPRVRAKDVIHIKISEDLGKTLLVVAFLPTGQTRITDDKYFQSVELWNSIDKDLSFTVPADRVRPLIMLVPYVNDQSFSAVRRFIKDNPTDFLSAAESVAQVETAADKFFRFLRYASAAKPTPSLSREEQIKRLASDAGFKVPDNPRSLDEWIQSANTMITTGKLPSEEQVTQLVGGTLGVAFLTPEVRVILDAFNLAYSFYKALTGRRPPVYEYVLATGTAAPDEGPSKVQLYIQPGTKPDKPDVAVYSTFGGRAKPPTFSLTSSTFYFHQGQKTLDIPLRVGSDDQVLAERYGSGWALENASTHRRVDLEYNPKLPGFTAPVEDVLRLLEGNTADVVITGKWGIDGPAAYTDTITLWRVQNISWITDKDQMQQVLISNGAPAILSLRTSIPSVPIKNVNLEVEHRQPLPVDVTESNPNEITIRCDMAGIPAGPARLIVRQQGQDKGDVVPIVVFDKLPASLKWTAFAADPFVTISANPELTPRDVPVSVIIMKQTFLNGDPENTDVNEDQRLDVDGSGTDGALPLSLANRAVKASIRLRDGREIEVPGRILPRRPALQLASSPDGVGSTFQAKATIYAQPTSNDILELPLHMVEFGSQAVFSVEAASGYSFSVPKVIAIAPGGAEVALDSLIDDPFARSLKITVSPKVPVIGPLFVKIVDRVGRIDAVASDHYQVEKLTYVRLPHKLTVKYNQDGVTAKLSGSDLEQISGVFVGDLKGQMIALPPPSYDEQAHEYYHQVPALLGQALFVVLKDGPTKEPVRIRLPEPPEAPKVVHTQDGKVALTWSPVKGAVAYNVYRASQSSTTMAMTPVQLIGSAKSDTLFWQETPPVGFTYNYRVSAVGTVGEGGMSLPTAIVHSAPADQDHKPEMR